MGLVVTYGKAQSEHEKAARAAIAGALARLKGKLYYVPAPTLQAGEASALGIDSEAHLFGVVLHGTDAAPPPGPLAKYTLVEPYARSQ